VNEGRGVRVEYDMGGREEIGFIIIVIATIVKNVLGANAFNSVAVT